jgi:signal transduction histidine kinase
MPLGTGDAAGQPAVAAGCVPSRAVAGAGATAYNPAVMTATVASPTSIPPPSRTLPQALAGGFRSSWLTILLIAATNTGFAAVLWVDDARPFWHPLVTCQLYGFAIAYCVNVARPWDRPRPIRSLALAVAIGALAGVVLVIVVKGYSWDYVVATRNVFGWNILTAFLNGVFVSLFFLVKQREARAEAALHKAEAARHLASRQVVEAELKMMQAQVEPHFLFNTLASVQYLTETDPPEASRLLGHLLSYLRAALPQLRSPGTTLGQEVDLAESYLRILQTRMGERLTVAIDVPEPLRAHPFPPVMLITLVENAIQHGLEPAAAGGELAIRARRDASRLVVEVADTGCGLTTGSPRDGHGVGLDNVRQRLAALYGGEGRFRLEGRAPRGAAATLEIPFSAP